MSRIRLTESINAGRWAVSAGGATLCRTFDSLPAMNRIVPTDLNETRAPTQTDLLDRYKADFELMCIQFLSGGWKLAVRDSVMALYQARNHTGDIVRAPLDELLITDGETVRALLELAEARGPAELQVCDAQLRRLRRRHTEIVFQLRCLFATAG